ncbi:MAG: hypothetical protein AVDCRST_MAG72-1346 [uncultured Nocardioidaceae bacterium]|uniref:Uncharacterized protein n=1 Tax=uncultured Nocardioidaceae bacterium TaxID=253824 RepID=A0A6J4M6E4_9ACTN|nr:MAG: hypothetical protein AVDCRST_MAG72-1346 [uncultured Nocardioidaceae bacterium]
MDDGDESRARPVLVGLAALVGVAVLIGAVVSAVALGLADVTGVSDGDAADVSTSPEQSLYVPDPDTPAESRSTAPAESPSTSPSPSQATTQATTEPAEPKTSKKPERRQITLAASPSRVPTFGRITLTGTYRGGDGSTLQVQRLEGGWVAFPTTATVEGGQFATYVESGQGGQNRFRVVDEATGRASAPVTVTVG